MPAAASPFSAPAPSEQRGDRPDGKRCPGGFCSCYCPRQAATDQVCQWAACHLALGAGFCDTVDGFENRSLEECRSLGVNDSIIHEDFMIGTADLDIDAETFDGRTIPIFRSGNWAF